MKERKREREKERKRERESARKKDQADTIQLTHLSASSIEGSLLIHPGILLFAVSPYWKLHW